MGATRRQQEVAAQPLRRVVEEFSIRTDSGVYLPRERLECGHVIRPKSDWHGETYTERRRCWKCAKGRPQDEPVSGTTGEEGTA